MADTIISVTFKKIDGSFLGKGIYAIVKTLRSIISPRSWSRLVSLLFSSPLLSFLLSLSFSSFSSPSIRTAKRSLIGRIA